MEYTMDDQTYAVSRSRDRIIIDGAAHTIEVLSTTHHSVEFLLDNKYHMKLHAMVGGGEYLYSVGSTTHHSVEFLLDNKYHMITYESEKGGKLELEVDGILLTLARKTGLDDIVYKNSGGAGAALTESALLSQIPGKVVSVAVAIGESISQGDTVCVLESMKMQVSVKAHISGSVKSVRAKVGANIAKGDMIAEIE